MLKIFSIISFFLVFSQNAMGFGSGAGTCDVVADYSTITAMQDRRRNPDSGEYEMTSSSPTYNSNEHVEITLRGPLFTGIMIEVVDDDGNKVGSFDTNEDQVRNCGGSAMAVTHSNGHGNVMSRSVFWIPPAESVGPVHVLAYVLSGRRDDRLSQEFYRFVREDNSAISIQPAAGEPSFQINQGISGSWFFPETAGSGFLIDVRPSDNFMFAAWFTHDVTDDNRPDADNGTRWYTLAGNYTEGTATLDILETRSGLFDDPQTVTTAAVGTATIEFSGCGEGTVSYQFTNGSELSGNFPIQRAVPNNEGLCQSLVTQ